MTEPIFAETEADIPSQETLMSMSGLAFMQAMLAGRLPHPAIARLLNYRLAEVAQGRAVFRATPGLAQTNPVGAVHGGWYGTVLDSAMGCAVMTCVPQGRWYTTLEYKISLIRALPRGTEVHATGIVEHAGRSTAVARGEIRGAADDRLYATGTTTCIILS